MSKAATLGNAPPLPPTIPSLISVQRSHSGGSADSASSLPPGFLSLVRQATTVQRQEHSWSVDDVGARCRVKISDRVWCEGTVAFVGQVQTSAARSTKKKQQQKKQKKQKKQVRIGVVLDESRGDCDGVHETSGLRYFACIAGHGIFRPTANVLFIGKLSSTPVDTEGWPISDARKKEMDEAKEGEEGAQALADVEQRALLTPEEIRLHDISEWDWYGNGASRRERVWKRFSPKDSARLTRAFLRRQKEVTLTPSVSDRSSAVTVDLDWMMRRGLVGKSSQSRQVRGIVLGQRAMPNRDLVDHPKYWETQSEPIELFDVVEGSEEFMEIDTMMRTHKDYVTPEPERCGMKFGDSSSYKTVKVKRVQNLSLWENFALRREIMKEQSPAGTANERMLFHGTGGTPPTVIYQSTQAGVDYRYAGDGYHGSGFYVSVAAKYSDNYGWSGEIEGSSGKWMFIVRCCIGVPKIYEPGIYSKSIHRPPVMTKAERAAVERGVPWNKVHIVAAGGTVELDGAEEQAVLDAQKAKMRRKAAHKRAPQAIVETLVGMGFPASASARACIASNVTEAETINDAINWLLAHSEDADFDAPLPSAADDGGAPATKVAFAGAATKSATKVSAVAPVIPDHIKEVRAKERRFDCVSGWHDGARMYILFDNAQCYPEYLVQWQS